MIVRILSLFTAMALAVTPAWAGSFPQPTVSYSADQATEVTPGPNGGPMRLLGKIYSANGNERRETVMLGSQSVLITRPDKGKTWVLMPQQKMYMEYTDNQMDTPTDTWRKADVTLVEVGKEMVAGMAATKYRVTFDAKDGQQSDGFVWLSQEKIALRAEGKAVTNGETTHFRMQLTNVKTETPDADLFEVPSGYSRFEMPAAR